MVHIRGNYVTLLPLSNDFSNVHVHILCSLACLYPQKNMLLILLRVRVLCWTSLQITMGISTLLLYEVRPHNGGGGVNYQVYLHVHTYIHVQTFTRYIKKCTCMDVAVLTNTESRCKDGRVWVKQVIQRLCNNHALMFLYYMYMISVCRLC